jgi:hypothetical protein
MSRTFRVLLDEPLDADEGNTLDAHGSNMADADGGNSQTHMGAIVGADGGNMADANGRDLNSFKHPLNTNKKTLPPPNTPATASRKRRRWCPTFGNSSLCFSKMTCIPKCNGNFWRCRHPRMPLSRGCCMWPAHRADILQIHWGMPSVD